MRRHPLDFFGVAFAENGLENGITQSLEAVVRGPWGDKVCLLQLIETVGQILVGDLKIQIPGDLVAGDFLFAMLGKVEYDLLAVDIVDPARCPRRCIPSTRKQ